MSFFTCWNQLNTSNIEKKVHSFVDFLSAYLLDEYKNRNTKKCNELAEKNNVKSKTDKWIFQVTHFWPAIDSDSYERKRKWEKRSTIWNCASNRNETKNNNKQNSSNTHSWNSKHALVVLRLGHQFCLAYMPLLPPLSMHIHTQIYFIAMCCMKQPASTKNSS